MGVNKSGFAHTLPSGRPIPSPSMELLGSTCFFLGFCPISTVLIRMQNFCRINDAPEIMKQMPPLPVKINEDLVNSLLPRPTVPMQ
jgi:hypothetical protein